MEEWLACVLLADGDLVPVVVEEEVAEEEAALGLVTEMEEPVLLVDQVLEFLPFLFSHHCVGVPDDMNLIQNFNKMFSNSL